MAITAEYRTECYECGFLIEPGDQIERVDGEHWQHATCPDDVAPDPADQPCTTCQLIHAGECF